MEFQFRWSPDLPHPKKTAAEEAIRDLQDSGESPFSLCHDGPGTVTLAVSELSPTRFHGTLACSCGRTRGVIKGKCNGTSVTFEVSGD
jgi:hypothetical protein